MATLIDPSPDAIEETRKIAIDSEAFRSMLLRQLAHPNVKPGSLRFYTLLGGSPWATGLHAALSDHFGQLKMGQVTAGRDAIALSACATGVTSQGAELDVGTPYAFSPSPEAFIQQWTKAYPEATECATLNEMLEAMRLDVEDLAGGTLIAQLPKLQGLVQHVAAFRLRASAYTDPSRAERLWETLARITWWLENLPQLDVPTIGALLDANAEIRA